MMDMEAGKRVSGPDVGDPCWARKNRFGGQMMNQHQWQVCDMLVAEILWHCNGGGVYIVCIITPLSVMCSKFRRASYPMR